MSYTLRVSQGPSRPSPISTFIYCSIFQRFLFDKIKKTFFRFKICFRGLSKFYEKKTRQFIVILSIHMRSHKKLRLSVTNKHPDKQSIYICYKYSNKCLVITLIITRELDFSIFFIHFDAWPCGSIIKDQRLTNHYLSTISGKREMDQLLYTTHKCQI